MNNEFRPVPSLDGAFEVNADGTALRRVSTGDFVKIVVDHHHSTRGYAYAFVSLHGRTRRVSMAGAVAECWLGPRPPGLEVDHVDRNPLNNAHTNLRYVTHGEQMRNRDHTRIAAVGRENLRRHVAAVSLPVRLTAGDGARCFPSVSACARWLAGTTGHSVNYARHLLRLQRTEVLGYAAAYGPRGTTFDETDEVTNNEQDA